LQIVAKPAKRVETPIDLDIEGRYVRRQQPMQIEFVALGLGEGCAFVQERIVQKIVAAERGRNDAFTHFVHHRGPSKETILTNGLNP
jgi:hypothetical protein